MLQVAHHVVQVDYAIPDLDVSLVAIADLFDLITLEADVIKVHPGAVILDFVYHFARGRSSEISVVVFVLHDVGLVEGLRVLHRQDQVDCRMLLRHI